MDDARLAEIVDDLEAALAEFTAVAEALEKAAAERDVSTRVSARRTRP